MTREEFIKFAKEHGRICLPKWSSEIFLDYRCMYFSDDDIWFCYASGDYDEDGNTNGRYHVKWLYSEPWKPWTEPTEEEE